MYLWSLIQNFGNVKIQSISYDDSANPIYKEVVINEDPLCYYQTLTVDELELHNLY